MPSLVSTLAAALALISSISGSVHQKGDVREIVRQVKNVYAATTSAEVSFVQTGNGTNMTGRLMYASGDRYRLELSKQTIISDGKKTWTVFADRNQVVVNRAAKGSDRLTPEQILTSFPGSYATSLTGSSTVNGKSTWIVKCVPGTGPRIADVTEATLYIDKATSRFHRIDVKSESLGTVSIRITSANYTPRIDNGSFSFTPPSGMKVIDLSR